MEWSPQNSHEIHSSEHLRIVLNPACPFFLHRFHGKLGTREHLRDTTLAAQHLVCHQQATMKKASCAAGLVLGTAGVHNDSCCCAGRGVMTTKELLHVAWLAQARELIKMSLPHSVLAELDPNLQSWSSSFELRRSGDRDTTYERRARFRCAIQGQNWSEKVTDLTETCDTAHTSISPWALACSGGNRDMALSSHPSELRTQGFKHLHAWKLSDVVRNCYSTFNCMMVQHVGVREELINSPVPLFYMVAAYI